jgi:hypothetical protein
LRRISRIADVRRSAADASMHRKVVEADTRFIADDVVSSGLLGPGIPFAHRNPASWDSIPFDKRLASAAQSCGYEDAHAALPDEPISATMDLLSKVLLQAALIRTFSITACASQQRARDSRIAISLHHAAHPGSDANRPQTSLCGPDYWQFDLVRRRV